MFMFKSSVQKRDRMVYNGVTFTNLVDWEEVKRKRFREAKRMILILFKELVTNIRMFVKYAPIIRVIQ